MGFQRFPNTVVISWMDGTEYFNATSGAYTQGTLTTLSTVANAQPQTERYAIDTDGNRKKVRYSISTPLIAQTIDRETATLTTSLDDYVEKFSIINLLNYQLHTEVQI